MTSHGKLVTIALVSKPPPLTRIVRTGLGTRLDTLLLGAGLSCRSVSKSLLQLLSKNGEIRVECHWKCITDKISILPILFPRCHLNGTFLLEILASSLTISRRRLLTRPIACFSNKNSFLLASIFFSAWRTLSNRGAPGVSTKLSLCFGVSFPSSSPLSSSSLLPMERWTIYLPSPREAFSSISFRSSYFFATSIPRLLNFVIISQYFDFALSSFVTG